MKGRLTSPEPRVIYSARSPDSRSPNDTVIRQKSGYEKPDKFSYNQKLRASNQPRPPLPRKVPQEVRDTTSESVIIVTTRENRCCCGAMHIFPGTVWIGVFEAIICLAAVVVSTVNFVNLGRNYLTHFVSIVCVAVIFMFVLAMLFSGLQCKTACLLIPNMILLLVGIILLGVTIGLILFKLINGDHAWLVIFLGKGPLNGELPKEAGISILTWSCVLIGVCAATILVFLWFLYITIKAYRYLQRCARYGLVKSGGAKDRIYAVSSIDR